MLKPRTCPQCGAPLPEDATICTYCGSVLVEDSLARHQPMPKAQPPKPEPTPAPEPNNTYNLTWFSGLMIFSFVIVFGVTIYLRVMSMINGHDLVWPNKETRNNTILVTYTIFTLTAIASFKGDSDYRHQGCAVWCLLILMGMGVGLIFLAFWALILPISGAPVG